MGQGLRWFKKDKLFNHFWISSLSGLRWSTDYKTIISRSRIFQLGSNQVTPRISTSQAKPFWEKSTWKEKERSKRKKRKNNAKFSGHYVYPRTETVRAHALRSHQHLFEKLRSSLASFDFNNLPFLNHPRQGYCLSSKW